jgi:hypothetical protein
MLGQHPQLFGLPETNLFARETYAGLRQLYRARPRFSHGLLRAVAQLGLGGQSEQDVATAGQWLMEHPDTPTGEIFSDVRAWSAPRAPVEKSPIHVYDIATLRRIERWVPDAYYLHLTRHPRGTCESIYSLRQEANERFEKTQRLRQRIGAVEMNSSTRPLARGQVDAELTPETMWLKPHMNIIEFLGQVPQERQLCLRGEDFLAQPETHLRMIADWMGIESDDRALEAMMHPERSPFARFGPSNALMGNDPSFLEQPALRAYHPKPSELDSPLSWDPELKFNPEVRACAGFFGY